MISMSRFTQLLGRVDFVSFDIYDTLVRRTVSSPTRVFELVGDQLAQQGIEPGCGFSHMRLIAQQEARRRDPSGEVALDQIYQCFPLAISHRTERLIQDVEKKTELEVTVANPEIAQFYEMCLARGVPLIATSDMYMPSDWLRVLLDRCGFSVVQEIFVSGELKKNKNCGEIYPYICEHLGVAPQRLVHIGDNWKSDYLQARRRGLRAIHYGPHVMSSTLATSTRTMDKASTSNQPLQDFLRDHRDSSRSFHYQFGYRALGILLYAFTRWLIVNLEKAEHREVFFLAREGELLRRAFELVYTGSQIAPHYLYLSRRSTLLPALAGTPELDSIEKLIPALFTNKYISYGELCAVVGIDQELSQTTCCKVGVRLEEQISGELGHNFYAKIESTVRENATNQQELLKTYLSENHFHEQVAVVDIGWKGSMQHGLTELAAACGLDVHIKGYYVGLSREAMGFKDLEADGFLFCRTRDHDNEELTSAFRGLFESLFMPNHGTTIRYRSDESGVVPVLGVSEYSADDRARLDDVQLGALQFIADFARQSWSTDVVITPSVAFARLSDELSNPSEECLKQFRDLSFHDHGHVGPLVPEFSIWSIFRRPKEFRKLFLDSPWRAGLLRQLVKIELDYWWFYRWIKQFSGQH